MSRTSFLIAVVLAACTPPTETNTETTLPLFGDGYRFEGDGCRKVGEDAYTNQYLDDAADLVACPESTDDLDIFVIDLGAIEVARRDRYVLYSVPIR